MASNGRRFGIGIGSTVWTFGLWPPGRRERVQDWTVFFGWWDQ